MTLTLKGKKLLTLKGKKLGMTQLFDESGAVVPCTVIKVQPNCVVQIKTKENDGYEAIQLGSRPVIAKDERTKERRVNKPQRGHFKKQGVAPFRDLHESCGESGSQYEVNQEIGVEQFADVRFIDACATSKGKGYQGLMKRNNFAGGPAAHGSGFHRHAGSTGMRSTPGRCLPGRPRASQMGNEWVTVQSLEVIKIVEEDGLLIVKGQVPGPRGGSVFVSAAVKKQS